MYTTLCFDFGNTRMKCGVFTDGKFREELVLEDDRDETIRALLDRFHPTRSILSSVIAHNPEVETILTARTQFHKLSHLTRLSFTMPVGKPETMGTDRLALAAAAVRFYPKKNNLVIGLGTCITFNFIDQFHVFDFGREFEVGKCCRDLLAADQRGNQVQLLRADTDRAQYSARFVVSKPARSFGLAHDYFLFAFLSAP